MKNLQKLFKIQFDSPSTGKPFIPRGLLWTFAFVAFLGFSDATYLTIKHFMNVSPPCVFGNCELVLFSKYSEIFGIPVALFGSIYYFAILLLTLLYIDFKKVFLVRTALLMTAIGLVMSLWFLYLQAFVLYAYCQYCLISGFTSLTLFVIAVVVFVRYGSLVSLDKGYII